MRIDKGPVINAQKYPADTLSLFRAFKILLPWNTLSISLAFIILSFLYTGLVAPIYNFGGMVSNARADWYIELLLLIIISFLLPRKVRRPSELYNWLYFCVLLVPAAVLSAQQGSDRIYLFLMSLGLLFLIIFYHIFSFFILKKRRYGKYNHGTLPFYSVMLFVFFVLIWLSISVRGNFNFNFQEVYNYRFKISAQIPYLLRYLLPLASSTLVGYLVALSIERKRYFSLFVIMVTGCLFFIFSSHKAMLFYPFIAISGYFLFKFSRPYMIVVWGYSLISCLILIFHNKIYYFSSLIANRVIFIPSHINFYYFSFFSDHDFMLWAESKVSFGLVDSQLPMPAMKYVGGMMTGNYNISANTGWIASAYMNGGVIGIIIYSAIIALIYVMIDSWAQRYGKEFVGTAFLIPVLIFTVSADLLITLLTHGLVVLLFLFVSTSLLLKAYKYLFLNEKGGFSNA